jgi:hypothetical protein
MSTVGPKNKKTGTKQSSVNHVEQKEKKRKKKDRKNKSKKRKIP